MVNLVQLSRYHGNGIMVHARRNAEKMYFDMDWAKIQKGQLFTYVGMNKFSVSKDRWKTSREEHQMTELYGHHLVPCEVGRVIGVAVFDEEILLNRSGQHSGL